MTMFNFLKRKKPYKIEQSEIYGYYVWYMPTVLTYGTCIGYAQTLDAAREIVEAHRRSRPTKRYTEYL